MDLTEHKEAAGTNGTDGAQAESGAWLMEHKEKQEQMDQMEHKVKQGTKWIRWAKVNQNKWI
jgi:hypothetical protein